MQWWSVGFLRTSVVLLLFLEHFDGIDGIVLFYIIWHF